MLIENDHTPIWQTPYKGRITAMTFGTIFAVEELYFFIYYYWHSICYPPLSAVTYPPSGGLVRWETTIALSHWYVRSYDAEGRPAVPKSLSAKDLRRFQKNPVFFWICY